METYRWIKNAFKLMLFATGLTFCVVASLSMGNDDFVVRNDGPLKKVEAWHYDVKLDSSWLANEEFYDSNGLVIKAVDQYHCNSNYKYDGEKRVVEYRGSCGETNVWISYGYIDGVVYDTASSGMYTSYSSTRTLDDGVVLKYENYRNYLGKTSGSMITISRTYYDGEKIVSVEEIRKEYYDPEIHDECEYDERDTVYEHFIRKYEYSDFDSLLSSYYINTTKSDTILENHFKYDDARKLKTEEVCFNRGHMDWKKEWTYDATSNMESEIYTDYAYLNSEIRSIQKSRFIVEKGDKNARIIEKMIKNDGFYAFSYENSKITKEEKFTQKEGELESSINYKYIYW